MNVTVFHTIREIRDRLATVRRKVTIGLVPTMGALHAGHGALLERARQECDFVIVSLFINPIQFDRAADFEDYPRSFEGDVEFCESRGVDIIFAPSGSEMYPEPTDTFVEVVNLAEHLCGAHRPGHFRGVTTVVTKLFNIIQPNRAYFGEKDAQQLAVIRHMVLDLNLPITIIGVETVREDDGVAVSSRNRNLNKEERAKATVLYRALEAARAAIEAGESDPGKVKAAALAVYDAEPAVEVEYLEIVDDKTMQPVSEISGRVRIATAALLGETRLIDNLVA